MMTALSITETNLSVAWAKAFLALMAPGKSQRHPAVITLDHLEDVADIEDEAIRTRLDKELKKQKSNLCSTVAGTLFPNSMWNSALKNNADALYMRYDKAWPGIAKCHANRNGVYFRRLTSYAPEGYADEPVNQLKFIINVYTGGNHRKSALQASILDPTRDHTNNRQKGFPCLQQVAFTPMEKERLSVTGFYATQYQFEKAYGNYLGLYWLGRFMAQQLELKLAQVVCIAAFLNLGESTKSDLEALEHDIRPLVEVSEVETAT